MDAEAAYVLQAVHCATHPDVDPNVRERWRGYPHFEYTARWVVRYDVPLINPNTDNAPLDVFVPMVRLLFEKPPREIQFPV